MKEEEENFIRKWRNKGIEKWIKSQYKLIKVTLKKGRIPKIWSLSIKKIWEKVNEKVVV